MVRIGTGMATGAREEICLRAQKAGLDLETARELAKRKAKEICAESIAPLDGERYTAFDNPNLFRRSHERDA